MLRVAARRLLRVHEVPVHLDLEHAPARRDEDEIGDLALELLQQPLRQTDGSRCVASLGAVLDRDPHAAILGPERDRLA